MSVIISTLCLAQNDINFFVKVTQNSNSKPHVVL